jgi:amino acid transporter
MDNYKTDSLTLKGLAELGTVAIIGAGIFAPLVKIAELSGTWFLYIIGAVLFGLSAYSYIKVSSAYPSVEGVSMILTKVYEKSTLVAAASVLIALSMIISESLAVRTFVIYVLQAFDTGNNSLWLIFIGVTLLLLVYGINVSGNKAIGMTSKFMAFIKMLAILVFAIGGLWAVLFTLIDFVLISGVMHYYSAASYLGLIVLFMLVYTTHSSGLSESIQKKYSENL